jgi:hypothetical protein
MTLFHYLVAQRTNQFGRNFVVGFCTVGFPWASSQEKANHCRNQAKCNHLNLPVEVGHLAPLSDQGCSITD